MLNPNLSLLLFITSLFFSNSSADISVHEILRQHGLPAGLIPKEIKSYIFEATSGLLEVRLDGPCYTMYDGPALFDSVVRGNLSYGALHGLVGLKQEELFLWLPVRGIIVADPSSGVILFDIGLAHKQLSLSLFEFPPECLPIYEIGNTQEDKKFRFWL